MAKVLRVAVRRVRSGKLKDDRIVRPSSPMPGFNRGGQFVFGNTATQPLFVRGGSSGFQLKLEQGWKVKLQRTGQAPRTIKGTGQTVTLPANAQGTVTFKGKRIKVMFQFLNSM